MENFRKKLKKRLALAGAYNGMVLLFLVISYSISKRHVVPDMAVGFASGFFVGIQIVMIYYIGKYHAALKNEDKLKTLYIAENDERSKFIESKIGGIGINIILGGTVLGTIVAGFFNETVFFTLLFTLIFTALVKGTLKLYYNKTV